MDNLDNLFDVIKGGVTKDFDIGHVSHRKDGDWKKVAQGKWVPVKAAGQGQMGANPGGEQKPTENAAPKLSRKELINEIVNSYDDEDRKQRYGAWLKRQPLSELEKIHSARKTLYGKAEQKPAEQQGGTESDGPNTAMQDERSQYQFRKHITHAIPMGKNEEFALNRISSYFEGGKRNASDAIDNYADHLIQENLEKGKNNEAQERAVMRIAHAIGYGHELHDKIKKARNGYDFGYDDEQGSFYEEDNDNTKPEPKANPYKEEQDHFMDLLGKASGNRYDDPSLVTVERDERGRWKTYYDGDYVGTFSSKDLDTESAEELGWFERPAPKFYEGQDDLEEASNELKERREQMYNNERYGVNQLEDAAAPPRLTADTKIRLSKIKRETCDARRTYRIGEISETTGLQKTANGWREVKKGGAGSAAPKATPEKKVFEGKGAYKGHTWTATKEGDKYKLEWKDADGKITNSELTKAEFDEMKTNVPSEGKAGAPAGGNKKMFTGSGLTKGHTWVAEKVGDKYVATHTYPDGRQVKNEISQRDYDKLTTSGSSENPKYYEDMGDLVEEKRAQRDKSKDPAEQRKLNNEIRELQKKMTTAPFGYEKSESVKRKKAWQNLIK